MPLSPFLHGVAAAFKVKYNRPESCGIATFASVGLSIWWARYNTCSLTNNANSHILAGDYRMRQLAFQLDEYAIILTAYGVMGISTH